MDTLFTPPYLYILAAIILVLSILVFRVRKRIYAELKRWRPTEVSLGPVKIERKEDEKQPAANAPALPASASPDSQLPDKRYNRFIGREEEIRELQASLRDPNAKRLIGLVGMGGIGKSALAREIVERQRAEKTFSSFLWLTAKQQSLEALDALSQDSHVNYETLLNRLIAWLGLASQLREETRLQQREAAVQKSLRALPALLVLDNLETAKDQEQVAERFALLLKDTPCRAILTSREEWKLARSAMEQRLLKGLDESSAIQLMRDTARDNTSERGLSAKDESLRKIARAVGCMPLALKLAVGLLDNLDVKTLLENLEQIRSEQVKLLYEYLFANTWRALKQNQKKMLVAISTFDEDEGVSSRHLHRAKVVSQDEFANVIERLVQVSLVEVTGGVESTRYTLHPLTLNFIRSQISANPT